ncbi:MAG: hypothetical protein R2911_39515 [Caldilineaceae bacterium]
MIALAVWALHLYVRWLPPTPAPIPEPTDAEAAWWGLWPATYAPTWFVVTTTVVLLGGIGALWLLPWAADECRQTPAQDAPMASTTVMILLASLGLLLGWAFLTFPIVHTRWGDAYLISKAMAWPDPTLRLTHSWQAPLDVFLHSQLWLFLHERFQWQDAMPVYRVLSPLAGILYLSVALTLSRKQWLGPAWLTFGSLTTLGLMQLFFGYIENYSFAAAGILLYLWLGLAALRHRAPLWVAALALAVTNATHPSTVVLAPSLLYIGWQLAKPADPYAATPQSRGYSWRTAAMQIGIPVVATAMATVLLMEAGGHGIHALLTDDRPGGGDARWLVPLFGTSTRWEYYTMFSWGHLRDFLNEQMLVAPVMLPALLWIGIGSIRHRWRDGENAQSAGDFSFLAIAATCYFGFTWLWNPDYGGQRDWDLFSLAAIPAALLFGERLTKVLGEKRYLLIGALPLLAVQAAHTLMWVYQNTLPWEWP